MKKRHFIFACLSFVSCLLWGQDHAKLHISAEPQSSQIRLRWAIDDPLAWQLANRYGYTLERIEILNNNVLTAYPRRRILNAEPIRPADSSVWEERFDLHQSYAILAQALFGESFRVSFQTNHPLFEAATQTQENEQRFSIALLAADQLFDAACLAGLGWVDSVVDPSKTYLYRLYVNTPDSLFSSDTTLILVSPSETVAFPKISNVFSETGDRSVFLSWSIRHFKGIYTGYIIEKSTDQRQFTDASGAVSLNISDDGETAFFFDTLTTNDRPYYYRIRGVNVFGTVGPVSDLIKVVGTSDFAEYPKDLTVDERGANMVLQWTFDEDAAKELAHFLVFHQSSLNGESSLLSRVSAQRRSWDWRASRLEASNYFTVVAVYKNGQERSSYACFYQPVDSVPPAPPTGLVGVADSSGVVTLSWRNNTEPDLDGYQVFRANRADQEVIQISKAIRMDTVFYDTVSINTAASVYYQVVALDGRGNRSDFSARVEVKRVDQLPPMARFQDSLAAFSAVIPDPLQVPRVTAFADRDNRQIVLSWQAPYTISEVQLFRKKDDEEWRILEIFEPSGNRYTDARLELNAVYFYRLKSVDDAGNHSPVSAPIRVVY